MLVSRAPFYSLLEARAPPKYGCIATNSPFPTAARRGVNIKDGGSFDFEEASMHIETVVTYKALERQPGAGKMVGVT